MKPEQGVFLHKKLSREGSYLEERVDCCGGFAADSQEGAERVAPASQVGELADVLQRVPLLRFQGEQLKAAREEKQEDESLESTRFYCCVHL